MFDLNLSLLVSGFQFSQMISLVLWFNDFLILLSEKLLLEFNGSIIWSFDIVDININWDDILLKNVDVSLESILLNQSSLNNNSFLVKSLSQVLGSLIQVLSLLFKNNNSRVLLVNFLVLESEIILELINPLLLSLLNILWLINVLLQEFNLSSQLLIGLSNSINISASSVYLWVSVFNISLCCSNLIIYSNSLLFSIHDGLL